MVAHNGGMLTHHQTPNQLRSSYSLLAGGKPFPPEPADFDLAPTSEVTPWPPAFTLFLAFTVSAFLWLGLFHIIRGAHLFLGWL